MRDQICTRLTEAFQPTHLDVQVDGNRATLVIVSEEFEGLNRVKRQQKVYALINDFISSGALHAVSIQAKSLNEWNG